ncbi:integrase [Phyllobacterium sp. 1468]|uniref:site-specific integrase n=1 Tax=Phyllobacterium sp. 1468 TaxID=2817759 RepID=UPI0028669B02|nr:site-specific integrase [Phyllobacterium sp. 1468]MDR6634580.1 integrase [Phyllobacterium sp. 1468]
MNRTITNKPSIKTEKTFMMAYEILRRSAKWQTYDQLTIKKNSNLIELFLARHVSPPDNCQTWSETPVTHLRRHHLMELLAENRMTPHKGKHLLVAIRKLIFVALEFEWIATDPSYKIEWRPAYKGRKAWTIDARQRFEAYHPIGSAARTCYGLAIWLGNRRGDIANLRWDDLVTVEVELEGHIEEITGFEFRQRKNRKRTGGKLLFIPMTPMLAEILHPLDRSKPTILVTGYGNPFSEKSLTGMMAHWTKQAGLDSGYTLHGLRKSLGKMLAEGGATTRELMEALGHQDIAHAELYSREANQKLLAAQAMKKLTIGELRRRSRTRSSEE